MPLNPESLIGKTLGNYRIVDRLGVGGMAAVFLGEHRTIGSKVAIKVLLPEWSCQSEVIRRFLDEARAAIRIAHSSIIRIHDCGEDKDYGAYLVMERLEGESLEERLQRRTTLPVEEALPILKQSCQALAAAHQAGIIHRDLKPSNLFLVPEPDLPGGERVKVLDFGIAKLLEAGLDGLTATGTKMGTPCFMAPEQCLDAKHVDPRTDIYALGVIGYLMISGHYPVPGEGTIQMYTKQTDPPISLKERGVNVPHQLDQLLLRALATRREDRFQSMEEFHQALSAPALLQAEGEGEQTPPKQSAPPDVAPTSAATEATVPDTPSTGVTAPDDPSIAPLPPTLLPTVPDAEEAEPARAADGKLPGESRERPAMKQALANRADVPVGEDLVIAQPNAEQAEQAAPALSDSTASERAKLQRSPRPLLVAIALLGVAATLALVLLLR